MLIYIISNGIHDEYDGYVLLGMLGAVLRSLPHEVVHNTFKGHSLSIRAIWDQFIQHVLVRCFEKLQSPFATVNESNLDSISHLINTLIYICPDWITGVEDDLLFLAASTGKSGLVNRLLLHGAHASFFTFFGEKTTIIGATIAGAQDCVQFLIESCDVNAPDISFPLKSNEICLMHGSRVDFTSSNFILFINYAMKRYDRHIIEQDQFLASLHKLLDAGANVDAPFPLELWSFWNPPRPPNTPPHLVPTCLDVSFYLCRPFFEQMQTRSSKYPINLPTRSGVCTAALGGTLSLKDYLSSYTLNLTYEHQEFLELVLLEQFFVRRHFYAANLTNISASIARALIEYGVAIRRSYSGDDTTSLMLIVWLRSVAEYGLSENLRIILHHLGQGQLVVTGGVLEESVEEDGVAVLDMVLDYNIVRKDDIASLGSRALVQAAKYENYTAVSWLLQFGVDINAATEEDLCDTCGPRTSTVIRDCLGVGRHSVWKTSFTMCRHLVDSGAKLRYEISDKNCYTLLEHALKYSTTFAERNDDCLATFNFFQSYQQELDKVTPRQWNIYLRKSLDYLWYPSTELPQTNYWALFKHLFQRFFRPDHGPILYTAIRAGCSRSLIETMLHAGAKINEIDDFGTPIYAAIEMGDFDLVHQLIRLGADLKAAPGRHSKGEILSTVLSLEVSSANEKREKMGMLSFLIDNGVDINGAHNTMPSQDAFRSPLQICAKHGDLDGAKLLLKHRADPNLIGMEKTFQRQKIILTALDLAASYGRLDMTKLLLKVGALSAQPGMTGYDGATERAVRWGYSAVGELIRHHVTQNEGQFLECPTLRDQHQAMVAHIQTTGKGLMQRG